MDRKKRLGVDIDLVVARTDLAWDKWLQRVSLNNKSLIPSEDINYNIGLYYKECLPNNFDTYHFWRSDDLYDKVDLVDNCKKALNKLKDTYDIIFISTIKGNHHKSKYYFIKEHFPYMKGFVATKEKYLVDVDIMIDDRIDNLENFHISKKTILFKTPYKQNNSLQCIYPFNKPKDWNQILEELI